MSSRSRGVMKTRSRRVPTSWVVRLALRFRAIMPEVSEAPPEPARLAAARWTALLDTPPEEAFDRLTRLAARLLGTPVALISLPDEDREFFKSATGLPEALAAARAIPLSYSFCRHVIESGTRLIVEDARHHPLVRTNPAIRELGWVAYAGVPL